MNNYVKPANINVQNNSLAIVGWEEGGPGQIHAWLNQETTFHVSCFVHPFDSAPNVDVATERRIRESSMFDFPENGYFKGLPLLCSSLWCNYLKDLGIQNVIIYMGDNRQRFELIEAARKAGFNLPSLVHPSALVLDDAVIHPGVIVMARAVIGYRAELFSGAVINTGVQIDHHNVIHTCSSFDPGVVTAGNVVIERFAKIHTGAVIINKIRVAEEAVVGAGAVVIRDVPAYSTVVGNPAHIIRKRNHAENLNC